jgi:UPF0755 protein
MNRRFYKLIGGLFIIIILTIPFFIYGQIYSEIEAKTKIVFEVKKGESVRALGIRLEDEGIIKSAWLFRKYIALKGFDRDVHVGEFALEPPISIARIVKVLREKAEQEEKSITILPGWNLRDIAKYLSDQGLGSQKEFFKLVGEPAKEPTKTSLRAFGISPDLGVLKDKPNNLSFEGYLAANTFRIFSDATMSDVILKLINHQNSLFTEQMYKDIKSADRNIHEVITMASLVEREVQSKEDKAKVADLFWRRYDTGWGLQADSTVHYLTGKVGDVFTTQKDRQIDSLWNTYKYAGLMPGPISSPSLESIMAAIYPESNDYWYFLTTLEGEVKYSKILEEHNINVQKYLR